MDISTILIIEKDNVTRRLMNQLLTARGYDVLEAANPRDAESLVEQNVPQLAIVEFAGPSADSLDVARTLHSRRGTPVLASATGIDDLDVPSLVAEGVMGVLYKPFEAEQLYVAVLAAIQLGVRMAHARHKQSQLEIALTAERNTSIAIGLLMERFRLDADNAFEMLRGYARTRRRRLPDLASDIVNAANVFNGPQGLIDDSGLAGQKKPL